MQKLLHFIHPCMDPSFLSSFMYWGFWDGHNFKWVSGEQIIFWGLRKQSSKEALGNHVLCAMCLLVFNNHLLPNFKIGVETTLERGTRVLLNGAWWLSSLEKSSKKFTASDLLKVLSSDTYDAPHRYIGLMHPSSNMARSPLGKFCLFECSANTV